MRTGAPFTSWTGRESCWFRALFRRDCPPLVEVPRNISQQSLTSPLALESYLRLHPVKPGEGLLGAAWERKEPLFLSSKDADPRLERLRDLSLEMDSVMIAPLVYANQNLGVLAVANGPMSTPFSPSDFLVFQSIVEQSAFALYSAVVYSEASEKRRIDRELDVARDIQRILLPKPRRSSKDSKLRDSIFRRVG